jgi:hypothetical protein
LIDMKRLGWIFITLLLLSPLNHSMIAASKKAARTVAPAPVDTTLLQVLRSLLPDSAGFQILSPLDPRFDGPPGAAEILQTFRVLCPDLASIQKAIRSLKDRPDFKIKKLRPDLDQARREDPVGYRGVIVRFSDNEGDKTVQLLTFQQLRWLLWSREILLTQDPKTVTKPIRSYAVAVSDYLDAIDRGNALARTPAASTFGLPGRFDLLQPISGDSIAFQAGVAEITTSFARGVTAIAPTDSVLAQFELLAPAETFSEPDPALFQSQCRAFFASGANSRDIKILSAANFSQLEAGEYSFSVSRDGTVRFVKNPVANAPHWSQYPHTLLFPEEPVLTSGTFTIEGDSVPRLSKVSLRSHYFYPSNTSPAILRSTTDHDLTTLGHLLQALDRLGIPYHNVLLSKL